MDSQTQMNAHWKRRSTFIIFLGSIMSLRFDHRYLLAEPDGGKRYQKWFGLGWDPKTAEYRTKVFEVRTYIYTINKASLSAVC